MNCEGVRYQLSAYIDGELHELERLQVKQHLRRCAACAAEEALLRQTVTVLHDLADPYPEVPPGFRESLRARLAALPPPVAASRPTAAPLPLRARRTWRRVGMPAAAAAAAAAILAFAYSPAGPFRGLRPVPLAGGAGLSGPATTPAPVSAGTRPAEPGTPAVPADGAGPVAADSRSGPSVSGPVTSPGTPGSGAGGRSPASGAKAGAGTQQPGDRADVPSLSGIEPSSPVAGFSAGVADAGAAKPAQPEEGTLVAITYWVTMEVADAGQAAEAVEKAFAALGGGAIPSDDRIYWVPAGKQDEARSALREIARQLGGRVTRDEASQVDFSDEDKAAGDIIRAADENLKTLDEQVRRGMLTPEAAAKQRARWEEDRKKAESDRAYWRDRARKVEFVVIVEQAASAAAPEQPARPASQP